MAASDETDHTRTQTNENLRTERDRSDDDLVARSYALAEDSEEVIGRARDRARKVLELARHREDERLAAIAATVETHGMVGRQRTTDDAMLSAEWAVADAQRLDERERRRLAMIQLLGLERDATDRTLAAERVLADTSINAREDLLAVVAHDLRNMLTAVMVNASVIVIARDRETMQGPAVQIQRVGAQMSQLLEDLLDFSSFVAGKLTLATADVELVQVVADAVTIHGEVARTQGQHLTMRSEVPSVIVHGDARRLTRLLMNLIGNALKFTPTDGRVEVSVSVIGDECEVAVADTGMGIPKDQLETVFERFHQVGADRRRSPGVGLGLYIVRLIADAHGGRVSAESGPSVGSTFRLRLPIKQ